MCEYQKWLIKGMIMKQCQINEAIYNEKTFKTKIFFNLIKKINPIKNYDKEFSRASATAITWPKTIIARTIGA